ncbi:hypothetical protein CDEF62S_05665 [Castellaniella defragrans]
MTASAGLDGLTKALTSDGGLLQPVSGALNSSLGGALGIGGLPVLQPALTNAGQAVDQILPLGLQQPLGSVGKTLDGVVSPAAGAVTQVAQTAGDGLGVGAPVSQLLTSLGGSLQQVGSGAGSAVPGLNGVISNLGATIANAGGIVHNTPTNTNPVGNTLNSATQIVAALTSTVGVTTGGGNALGGILGGGSNPVGGLLGGNGSSALAPVTGLLGGGNGSGSASLLSPVTNLLTPVTGALGVGQSSGSTGSGALAPVTGLLGGGLLGGGSTGGLVSGLLGGK